jgi:hypothetical protein
MIKYDYAQDKFSTAIAILVVQDLPLRDRLDHALLHIRALNLENLPEDDDLRNDWKNLKECRLADKGDGELTLVAREILDLADKIALLYYQNVCETMWQKATWES